jgi:hypothetical protein
MFLKYYKAARSFHERQIKQIVNQYYLIIFKINLHKTKNISIFDYSFMPIGITIIL